MTMMTRAALALSAIAWQCAPAPRPQPSSASAPPAASENLTVRSAPEAPIAPETPPPGRPHTRFPAGQGRPCFGSCEGGMVCMRYFAGAGPIGPSVQTCEYPCEHGRCPEGYSCIMLAGGPSRACRPGAD